MLSLLLSLSLSFTTGYLLAICLLRTKSRNFYDRLLRLSLGTGFGLGISSCIFFVSLLLFTPSGDGLLAFDACLHVVLITGLLILSRRTVMYADEQPHDDSISTKPLLSHIVVACLVISILTLVLMALQSPYGGHDAMGIWNIRARVLLKANNPWLQDLVTTGQHTDYPLLLPALVARFWAYYGHTAWWLPLMIQGLFAFSAIMNLAAVITKIRGVYLGSIAGLVLLGTPFFLRECIGQQADVTVAYYLLAAVALVSLKVSVYPNRHRLECAAGLMAGFAAWTKNEGILFLVVLLLIRALLSLRQSGIKSSVRSLFLLTMGLFPVGVLLIYFKTQIAPQNDLVLGQGMQATLARLLDFSRYYQILTAFLVDMLGISRFQIYPILLAAYLWFSGFTQNHENRYAGMTIFGIVVTLLGGFFLVYLTTPHDLTWHLKTSLHRILLQIWPATLLMVFLVVKKRELRPPILEGKGA